jgi:hypothetical protein
MLSLWAGSGNCAQKTPKFLGGRNLGKTRIKQIMGFVIGVGGKGMGWI